MGLKDITGGSCHKYHFCHDKSFVMIKHIFCCNNSMLVATKVCLSWQNILVMTNNFVVTEVLSRQAYFCCYKHMFVVTKDVFCRNKTSFLSRRKYAYCSKTFIATKTILMAAPTNDKEEGCWKAILGVCDFLFSSLSSTTYTLYPPLLLLGLKHHLPMPSCSFLMNTILTVYRP